uniref:ER membrane protein complex subunit 2 n=1 Tax=Caenorhabditis tropicalis TaxID=1561998 RepID=A0A1I7TGE6_9PELO
MVTTDWTQVSYEEGRQTLKKWRECGVRRSEEVVEIWEHVISRSPSSLGDEQWAVLEQVCIASLDAARVDLAQECIDLLHAQFPNSNRVLKLKGMQLEATEHFQKALDIYERLVEEDPNNNSYRKRKVAVLLAQGKRLDAIRAINEYLKIFLNDPEAWLQLSELYLLENDVPKSVHCLEECVLIQPLNSMYFRRLGDLRYTQGGADNVELARAYYERALKINPTDLRSQYGILLVRNPSGLLLKDFQSNNQIASTTKSPSEKKKAGLAAVDAIDNLVNRYQKISPKSNPESDGILNCLEAMKVTIGSK